MPLPPLTPLAAAVLHVPAPERALVIGCGDGDGVFFLSREFPAARVRGVDPAPELVRAASARVGLDPEGRVAFKQGGPSALPYPDGFFDLVAHLGGRPSASEIARVLRPGAHLILIGLNQPGFGAGLRKGLLLRRLARLGIEPVAASASDGNFFVGRLANGE